MKPGLDVLPIENWMQVFVYPWIGREQLAAIVDRFRERKFIRFLQYFLHRWGKHKLNKLAFDKNGMYKWVDYDNQPYLDFPLTLTPLPENIKSFDCVAIDDSDGYAQGLAFLRIIKPILKDVDLTIYRVSPNNMENLRLFLDHLTPLLNNGGIHSLHCNACALPTIGQHLGDKLAKLKVLNIFHADDDHVRMDAAMREATVKFILKWLTSPGRDGNEPKLCKAFIDNQEFGEQITKAIRKQFQEAKTPSTFALILPSEDSFPDFFLQKVVQVHMLPTGWEIAEFHDTNNGIGEELHGLHSEDEEQRAFRDTNELDMRIDQDDELFRLIRHQSGHRPQLQQWIEENQYHGQLVAVSIPADPMDAAKLDAPKEEDNEKKDEDKDLQKASTSKQV